MAFSLLFRPPMPLHEVRRLTIAEFNAYVDAMTVEEAPDAE